MAIYISGVQRHESSGRLFDYAVDLPAARRSDGYMLEIAGWAVGLSSPVEAVHVNVGDNLLMSVPISVSRPDVPAAFPASGAPTQCGFAALVTVVGLPPTFELRLFARHENQEFTHFADISASHDLLPSGAGAMDPLLVTSLGRTGTSWLMHLLANHKQIVTHTQWGYEVSVTGFWANAFRSHVTRPHGFERPGTYFPADLSGSWWGGQNPFEEPAFVEWFASQHVEDAADHTRRMIERTYQMLAEQSDRSAARVFAEKARPTHDPYFVRELFGGTREIVLVRDFRDMVASILAFNAKRGFAAFDRHRAAHDEDYPHVLKASVKSFVDGVHARPDALVVRYEDLVTEPVDTLRRVFAFAGVHNDTEGIRRILEVAEQTSRAVKDHRTIGVAADSVGRWHKDLTPSVAAACEEAFGEALDTFGYR